jgi:hypothetical protein
MATSTTTAYLVTAQRIIDLALMDVGVAGQGGSVDPNLRAQALDHLNLLLKRLDAEGVVLWRVPRRTQVLVSGQASYILTDDTYDLVGTGRYTQSGQTYGSQVTPMAREEYMGLPDRTITGIAYRYFVERALDATGVEQATMYLYPVPAVSGDTFEYAAQLRAKDVTDLSQTLDVSQKWMSALRWGLAHALAPSYGLGVDRLSYFNARYEDDRDRALEDDNERGDFQIVPFGNQYGYQYGQWHGGGYR